MSLLSECPSCLCLCWSVLIVSVQNVFVPVVWATVNTIKTKDIRQTYNNFNPKTYGFLTRVLSSVPENLIWTWDTWTFVLNWILTNDEFICETQLNMFLIDWFYLSLSQLNYTVYKFLNYYVFHGRVTLFR